MFRRAFVWPSLYFSSSSSITSKITFPAAFSSGALAAGFEARMQYLSTKGATAFQFEPTERKSVEFINVIITTCDVVTNSKSCWEGIIFVEVCGGKEITGFEVLLGFTFLSPWWWKMEIKISIKTRPCSEQEGRRERDYISKGNKMFERNSTYEKGLRGKPFYLLRCHFCTYTHIHWKKIFSSVKFKMY